MLNLPISVYLSKIILGVYTRVILLFFTLLLAAACFSQKREQFDLFSEKNYFGFHFDDDFLFIANRDEQYTGGLAFEYIRHLNKQKSKTGIFNPFPESKRYLISAFGSYLFTPYNVSDSLIILNDRPFSSYIYNSIGYVAYDKTEKKRLSAELYLGIMGSPLPGKVQDLIHQVGDSKPTSGWGNRLMSTETFIPNLNINYQKIIFRLGEIHVSPIKWIEIAEVFKLNAGFYMNNISGGMKVSVFKNPPIYWFQNSGKPNPLSTKKARFSAYFMPQLQLVLHNTTLQGLPWLSSPYVVTPDYINRHVWMLEAGLTFRYKRFHLNYIVQARSREFKKYQKDWHTWAGITAGLSF